MSPGRWQTGSWSWPAPNRTRPQPGRSPGRPAGAPAQRGRPRDRKPRCRRRADGEPEQAWCACRAAGRRPRADRVRDDSRDRSRDPPQRVDKRLIDDDAAALSPAMPAAAVPARLLHPQRGQRPVRARVGMDVVQSLDPRTLEHVQIHSEPAPARASIRVPLTLAILPTLLRRWEDVYCRWCGWSVLSHARPALWIDGQRVLRPAPAPLPPLGYARVAGLDRCRAGLDLRGPAVGRSATAWPWTGARARKW